MWVYLGYGEICGHMWIYVDILDIVDIVDILDIGDICERVIECAYWWDIGDTLGCWGL